MKSTTIQNRWRLVVLAALAWIAVVGIVASGCSGEDDGAGEDVACEQPEDCPEDHVCDRAQGMCVLLADADTCDDSADCADGEVCDPETGICVDEGGVDFTCESALECDVGEICSEHGVCVEDEVVDEDYNVSFVAEARSDTVETELRWVDVGAGSSEVVDTGDIDCEQAYECGVTPDGNHLLVVERDGDGGFDASVASLEGDPPSVSGSANVFAEGVDNARIRGDGVAFESDDGSHITAHFQPHDGDAQHVATLHDVDAESLLHRWDIHPQSGRVSQYIPVGLRSLDVRVGSTDEVLTSDDQVHFFDGANVGTALSSHYLRSIPTGFSEDGRFVAFYTEGPNYYEECEANDDCSGTSQQCGEENRCFAAEATVNVVDMEHTDMIGEDCLGHEDCGPVHRCDSTSTDPDDFDGGECAPQRIVVGLTTLTQGPESEDGCEATRAGGDFPFTDAEPPFEFGPDGRVYFVGTRDCARSPAVEGDEDEANIPRTSVVAADPATAEIEEIWGNTDNLDFTVEGCYADDGTVEDDSMCAVYIDEARLSPAGDEVVFRATNAASASEGLNQTALDVWKVRRDGENAAWIGDSSAGHTAYDVNAHR